MSVELIDLVSDVKIFPVSDKGKAVHTFFESEEDAEGVVVMDDGAVAGIIMRSAFYHKIAHQYGYSLYYNRAIDILMKRDMLKVKSDCSLATIGRLAMERKSEDLYDFIVVEDEDSYRGVLSIRNYLIEMARLKDRELELLKLQNQKEIEYTKDLAKRNMCIKSLLDNTGQGFFNFGSDLVIAEEYSRECIGILGRAPGGLKADELFSELLSEKQLREVMDITAMVFSENDRPKSLVYLGLMPGELIIGRRNIRFEYKIIELEERKQIMVIMTDITEKLQLENQMAEERKNLKLITKCITSMSELRLAMESFAEFYQNALSETETDKDFPEETLRQIHTFKGDFSQLSMYNTSEKLHVLENGISGIIREGEYSARRIREYLRTTDSESIMRGDRQIISDILGSGYLDKEDYLNLSKERLAVVEKRLTERFGANYAQEIQRIMSMLQYISLKQAVRQYDDYIQAMAERLEKKILPIEFTGQDVYVEKSAYYNLIKSLVHIFRNIADHGIEYPELRELMGKDGCGHIRVDIAVSEDREVVLRIEDDGAGIDCGGIRNKAIQKGLITAQQAERMSETETLELLFEQGFSTKEKVTAISGRGVGLPAVRAQLINKGGSIRISSGQGRGTVFELRFPIDAAHVDVCGLAG